MGCEVVLASRSPRRIDLLRTVVPDFIVDPADLDESLPSGGDPDPEAVAAELAARKADEVAVRHPNSLVIGADTVVALDSTLFGKPESPGDAERMLHGLSGKTHRVITAVALRLRSQSISFDFRETTRVTFRELTHEEISRYVATGEPFDKAGGYAVQGGAREFVAALSGDYDNVVGLPVTRLKKELKSAGFLVAD